jgi:hypothetical protein
VVVAANQKCRAAVSRRRGFSEATGNRLLPCAALFGAE